MRHDQITPDEMRINQTESPQVYATSSSGKSSPVTPRACLSATNRSEDQAENNPTPLVHSQINPKACPPTTITPQGQAEGTTSPATTSMSQGQAEGIPPPPQSNPKLSLKVKQKTTPPSLVYSQINTKVCLPITSMTQGQTEDNPPPLSSLPN